MLSYALRPILDVGVRRIRCNVVLPSNLHFGQRLEKVSDYGGIRALPLFDVCKNLRVLKDFRPEVAEWTDERPVGLSLRVLME